MPRSLTGRSALVLVVAGLLTLGLHAWRVAQAPRYVKTIPLDLSAPRAFSTTVNLTEPGAYELLIEASRNVPDPITRAALEVVDRPSPISLSWLVERDGERVAAGNAADYLFIDRGPRSALGGLRRVLLRVPDGQDELSRRSLGLLGDWTVARGIGRFRAPEVGGYELAVAIEAPWPALVPAEPRLVLRHERRVWDENYRRSLPLAYAGLMALGLGLGLAAVVLVRGLLGRSRNGA